jgi:hypothetical protein
MAADRPYGEFYDFYSISLEYFGYHHVTNILEERSASIFYCEIGDSRCLMNASRFLPDYVVLSVRGQYSRDPISADSLSMVSVICGLLRPEEKEN